MARNHIQVLVLESDVTNNPDIDWMNTRTMLAALRPEPQADEVQVIDQRYVRERGCYVLLCEHASYPEVADYEEAPTYKLNDPEVVPSGA